jgi:hypothetical protein
MPTIWADVSKWQDATADNTYPHRWISFRACDGTYIDPKFVQNHQWAHAAAKAGKLTGYTVYCVYRPGVDVLAVLQGLMPKPDKYLTVMVDVESWDGQITGDHSADIAALCQSVADWLGSRDRVLAYGNQNDLANLFPHRPSWLRLVVASYGSQRPTVPGLVAWQYTDGSGRWPMPAGLPDSSPPFGKCDHNIAPDYTPKELASLFGVGKVIPAPVPTPAVKRHPRWAIEHIFRPTIARLRARIAQLRRHK